jgi:hypothetical protein
MVARIRGQNRVIIINVRSMREVNAIRELLVRARHQFDKRPCILNTIASFSKRFVEPVTPDGGA